VKLVIDASVAVKWFVAENGHDDAVAILKRGDECFAPDLLLPEVAGAFDKKIKAGAMEQSQAIEALKALQGNMTMVAGAKLIEESLLLASELNHPVADCIYMACAMGLGAKLVTADKVFLKKAADAGYRRLVVGLGQETESDVPAAELSDIQISAIEKLAREAREVFDFVSAQVSFSFGKSDLRIYSTGDLRPAFDSPAYARLVRHLDSLAPMQRRQLIALCWLGRGFDGENWSSLLEHARSMESGDKSDTPYIISKLSHLSAGVERLKELSETKS